MDSAINYYGAISFDEIDEIPGDMIQFQIVIKTIKSKSKDADKPIKCASNNETKLNHYKLVVRGQFGQFSDRTVFSTDRTVSEGIKRLTEPSWSKKID